MASFNKVILLGNLTRDPETRTIPSGTMVCKFGLAVNRRYRDRNGNDQEDVTFVDVEAWDRQAEVIAKYMQKGRPIFVEGRLQLDQWEQDGQKRSRLFVRLENFQFISSGDQDGGSGGRGYDAAPSSRQRSQSPQRSGVRQGSDNFEDDDVPF